MFDDINIGRKSVLETVTFDRSTLLQNFCLKQLNKTDIYESKVINNIWEISWIYVEICSLNLGNKTLLKLLRYIKVQQFYLRI